MQSISKINLDISKIILGMTVSYCKTQNKNMVSFWQCHFYFIFLKIKMALPYTHPLEYYVQNSFAAIAIAANPRDTILRPMGGPIAPLPIRTHPSKRFLRRFRVYEDTPNVSAVAYTCIVRGCKPNCADEEHTHVARSRAGARRVAGPASVAQRTHDAPRVTGLRKQQKLHRTGHCGSGEGSCLIRSSCNFQHLRRLMRQGE